MLSNHTPLLFINHIEMESTRQANTANLPAADIGAGVRMVF